MTQLEHKSIDFENHTKGVNEFEFTLPHSNRLIKYKLLCSSDDRAIDAEIKRLQDLEAVKLLREKRNNKLSQSDWRANSDVTMSDEWKTYRQQLRDITKTANPKLDTYYNLDPSSITWPTEPS